MALSFNQAKADAQFELLLDQILYEVSETELTPEKRRLRRSKADVSPLDFAKTYFPKVFTEDFNRVHLHLASLKEGKYSISGFPQSGKSAFTYLGIGMQKIALGMGGIFACTARDMDTATQATKRYARIIKRHTILCYDYDLEIIQDSAGDYIFKSQGGTTHVIGGSVSTGLRNKTDDDFKRIKFAIGDDLYNKESVRSESDNKRVFEWITGELWRQMEYDGLCIVLGNSINEGCPINLLKADYPDQHFSFPIADEDGNSNWPDRLSLEDIAQLEADTPSDVWYSEYLDDPLEVGEEFDVDWLSSINVNTTEILASITAVDPSHGSSPAACYKAACTLSILSNHKVVMTGIYIRKESYPLFFNYLREKHLTTPKHRAILFEDDFSQWAFAQPYYMEWLKKEETPLPITRYLAKDLKSKHRSSDKDSRILTLVHPHQTGLFTYDEAIMGTSDYELYRRQYLNYGSHGKKKLDGLDATATAYLMIRAYIETSRFKATGRRKMAKPGWDRGGGWM